MTATLTEIIETQPIYQIIDEPEYSDDKPNSAHYVNSPVPGESGQAYLMRARIEGFPVTALCGYQWVPSRMATGLPICQECDDLFKDVPDDNDGALPHE